MPAVQHTPHAAATASLSKIPDSVLHLGAVTQESPPDPHLRLSGLTPGDRAQIVGYERQNARYLDRLLAMGLTRGTPLKLLRVAPMGDPVDIMVRGYHLTLRKEEAAVLRLERLGDA